MGWGRVAPDNLSGRCKLSSSDRSVSRSERAHPSIHAAALIPISDGGGGGAIRVGDCRRRCHCLSSFSPSEGKCDILTDWGLVGSLPDWLTDCPRLPFLDLVYFGCEEEFCGFTLGEAHICLIGFWGITASIVFHWLNACKYVRPYLARSDINRQMLSCKYGNSFATLLATRPPLQLA